MKVTRIEKNYVSKYSFRNWINIMYKQFTQSNAVVQIHKNCTYVYLRSKVGTAKCNFIDIFDDKIGIAYAWARCTGQPVYYEKEPYTPKADEWVYIKTIDNKIRGLVRYMCEGIDCYCFKSNRDKLTLVKKTDVIDIAPAD